MKIFVAKDAGYCFGVRDAVGMAHTTAEKYGNVYMLGDIVHNEQVVEKLKKVGAKVVQGLKVLHAKMILHRDLKSENILCTTMHDVTKNHTMTLL